MDGTVGVDGTGLTCAQVRRVARDGVRVAVAEAGRARARAAWDTMRAVARRRPVYGQATGVGANRDAAVAAADTDHGIRLVRSHATDAGPPADPVAVRAMLVVRLNQLAAGGSGANPALLDALAEALNRGLTPPVRRYGAIGTGDLAALASTALCLLGERPWQGGTMPAVAFDGADALAFLSSGAATVGEAALAADDLAALLRAGAVVTALAWLAVDGSAEPFAAAAHDGRHPGQGAVAAQLRTLVAPAGQPGARIQDPYAYRAFPQVHGAAVDAHLRLDAVLAVELNGAGENPLVDVAGDDVLHNGTFHAAALALGLDTARLALVQTAGLSAAQLGTLVEPAFTGLRPFLADGPDPSSGVLMLEYVAHSALADLRHQATPTVLGGAVLSRGAEEHASFATQSARNTAQAVDAYRTVLACALVAAVRALRLRGTEPEGPLGDAHRRAAAVLGPDTHDRPLDADLAAAARLLPELATG